MASILQKPDKRRQSESLNLCTPQGRTPPARAPEVEASAACRALPAPALLPGHEWLTLRLSRVRWAGVPLDTASINIVVTIWTFCTIPDAHRGLVESCTRVLKPGGALLFVEPAPASDAKDCAAAAGAALALFLRGLGCRCAAPPFHALPSAPIPLNAFSTSNGKGTRSSNFARWRSRSGWRDTVAAWRRGSWRGSAPPRPTFPLLAALPRR